MVSLQVLMRRLPALGALAVLLMLALPLVAQAAGSVTIRDDAGLFTSAGRDQIQSAAQSADLRVLVITNNQPFSSVQSWQSWLRGQAGDSGTLTIGLHARRSQQNVYSVAGSDSGISQSQAQQAVHNAVGVFNRTGVTAGVVQVIQNAHAMGAASPGATSSGVGWGWLIPVAIILLLFFAAWRIFGARRRYTPTVGTMGGPYNQPGGPYNQYGGPYQGHGYGGPGWFGGRPGWGGGGFLSGLLGGLGGAWLGNQLFGNRDRGFDGGNGDQNAGGPTDTQDAQSMQGGWTDDSGNGGNVGGGWGDSGGGNGGWGNGGNDSGGWGDATGGGDWGGGGDGGQWT